MEFLKKVIVFWDKMKGKKLKASANNIYFLGVSSIVLSWFYGIPGILLSRYALKLYQSIKRGTGSGSKSDKSNRLKHGYILACIGLCISSAFLIFTIWIFILSLFS